MAMICENGVRECTGCMTCADETPDTIITCKNCGNKVYDEREIFDCLGTQICKKCSLAFAEGMFSVEKGLSYVSSESYLLEEQFFVGFLFNSDFRTVSAELLAICKREYLSFLDGIYRDVAIGDLRDFCLDDDGISFLNWMEKEGYI